MLCNMERNVKVTDLRKTNHDNLKLNHKNVNVVENNYIKGQEGKARVLLPNLVSYHDDNHILTFER